jgi:hypothetical protein
MPDRPFSSKSPKDADGDGVPDASDLLPFSAGTTSWPSAKLPEDRDGLPDALPDNFRILKQFNFAGEKSQPVHEFTKDSGQRFSDVRGFGWDRDHSANHRHRRQLAETIRDTFLFTREFDRCRCQLPNGRYRVTVCVGDSGFEQADQRVTIEGNVVIDDVSTGAGEFFEKTLLVELKDGELNVDIGRKG